MFNNIDLQLNLGFRSENCVYTVVGFYLKSGFKIFVFFFTDVDFHLDYGFMNILCTIIFPLL